MKQLWQENKGSISLFATISIITLLMILFLSVNIGNIFAKKNLVQNTADNIAPALLAHQITQYYNNNDDNQNNDIATSITPDSVVRSMLLSLKPEGASVTPLDGASYAITFGIFNRNVEPNTFTPLTTTSTTNPELDKITLHPNEDLAVKFYLKYDASPISTLLESSAITLKGKAMYTMDLTPLEDEGEPSNGNCCCQMAGGDFTWMGFTCSPRAFFGMGRPCTSRSNDQICIDFFECQGTFWDNLKNGTLFSSFLDMLKCWLEEFLQKIIDTIKKVDQAIIDAHDWDNDDNIWQNT